MRQIRLFVTLLSFATLSGFCLLVAQAMAGPLVVGPQAVPTPFWFVPTLSDSDPVVPGLADQPELNRPPTAIRVIHDRHNTCRPGVPVGQIDLIDFETYVKRVVPSEVYTSWQPAALRAQAIAARTYAWYKVLENQHDYDVTDWTTDQLMCTNQYPSTDAAVDATRGQSIQFNNQIAFSEFSAQSGNVTASFGTYPYLQSVPDPVGIGKTRRGHGHGLSQEGAQAWARLYGWNELQILAHYYTGAVVRPPPDQPGLLSSVIEPWNGWYLSGSVALLKAMATAGANPVSRVEFQIAYQGSSGQVNQTIPATNTGDSWQAAWDYRNLAEQGPIGAIQIRSLVTDAANNTTTGGEIQVALDRTAPTSALHPPAAPINTITATLGVAAVDNGPAGLAGYGLSDGWLWEGESQSMTHSPNSGYVVQDLEASGGAAWRAIPGQHAPGLWSGPRTSALFRGRSYRALYRMRTATVTTAGVIARLDVVDKGGSRLLGLRDLRGGDFAQADAYQEIGVDFDYPADGGNDVEFRTHWLSNGDLTLDRVLIIGYPQLSPSGQIDWRLTPGEGTHEVTLKAVDLAGNVSSDLNGTVNVVDTSPPTNWQAYSPSDWVTTTHTAPVSVRVIDEISGLNPAASQARVSADGGHTWSTWMPVTTDPPPGVGELQTLRAGIGFGGDSETNNLVQFQAADPKGQQSTSPIYTVKIDTVPPTTTVTAPATSASITYTVSWQGYDATSGVAGYDFQYRLQGGNWTQVLTNTTATDILLQAPSRVDYGFRARATDRAGLVGLWSNVITVTVNLLPPTALHRYLPVLERG